MADNKRGEELMQQWTGGVARLKRALPEISIRQQPMPFLFFRWDIKLSICSQLAV